ncbi:hypothetical protein HCN44_005900 [Aphidius gifuensis]|uniref:Uncharacterized protein n=1 Tax=Aphidius gifuensis TaxID=684658 RepID=A0A835CQQ0_APHGI|nr:hypothetical protein HCN44_005900 [Aphidius gifuensis]
MLTFLTEIQLQKSIEEIKNPILLHQSNSATELQHQFEPIIDLTKDKHQQQHQQQGYFTSILSSLPNLSLSGIRDQPQQPPSQATIFDSPQTHSTAGLNSSTNSTPPHFSPVHFSSGTSNDPSRPIAPPTVALPPPSAVPPVPPVSGSVSSYRLGNQRRLKYALPPDLKSIPTKNSFETSPKPEFINSTYSTSSYVKNDNDNKYIENIENVHSTLSSEFSSNEQVSEPQEIPTRKIYRDLVTPNNTPADYFLTGSTFDTNYQSNRDDADAIAKILKNNSSTSQFTPQSNTTNIDNFADIDLSQSFSQSTIQIKQNQQSPEVLFAPVATTTTSPIDFFSSNTTSTITEPSITSFFDNKNSLKSDNNIDEIFPGTIQVEQQQQEPSNVSLYNPLDYTSKTYNQQCNIDSQSPISFASNIQSSLVNDGNNINNWSASPLSSFMTNEIPESTGTATLSPIQTSINPLTVRAQTQQQDTIPPSLHSLAAGADKKMQYRPVYHHWFYSTEVENKILWHPFSMYDSLNLEEVHNSSEITIDTKVPTDGGRYDVEILKRQRLPVYWSGKPSEVKRSSWFYKGPTGSKYVPYDENIASRLEEEYKQACSTEHWNRKIEVGNGEYIVFHSPTIQIHYLQANSSEFVGSWGNTSASENNGSYLQGTSSKVKVVKRGVDEFHIEEGEPEKIDHLLFLVHGIGSVCDLKFRSVEEVVDEFRSISLQLVQSHYRTAGEQGVVNRIEVLPISWHTTLHSEDTGIDKKLKAITLESIPRLRHFTNDTLLDVLFYTSPTYCQTIMQTVGNEMNRLHSLFKERNTNFNGNIYLGGHSLGSLIVFDLLCHQKPPVDDKKQDTIEENENSDDNDNDDDNNNSNNSNINIDNTVSSTSIIKPMPRSIVKRKLSRKVSYVMGAAGTGQPFIIYPHLNFNPKAFFALGSPIGMFVTVRGIDTLGEDFHLPTCPAFFNIFHPFDPVAYRVESLVNPDAHKYRPMLIPHHKGRKRMHLELKETMARVGADLKQKLLDSVKSTWNSVYQLAMFHRSDNQTLENEINKVVEEEMVKPPNIAKQLQNNGESEDEIYDNDYDKDNNNFKAGNLNGGRRIDYVLQEAPFEYINEYIFALTSHVCYWESEDTMLMILKEIYGSNGIQADAQLPQQTMTIERQSFPSQSTAFIPATSAGSITTTTDGATTSSLNTPLINNDPTTPIINKPVGPPPLAGFVRPKKEDSYREFHYGATAPED